MSPIKYRYLEQRMVYTGKELRSGWIGELTQLSDDAMIAFVGPADVPIENMVDLEDVANDAPIYSPMMLHFIVEHFNLSLKSAVLRQRLLMAVIAETLRERGRTSLIVRKGDDLFDGDRKLSVSIAAPSPRSCCLHVGLNVETAGTPVATVGLADYEIDPQPFAQEIMRRYGQELEGIAHACSKVRKIP